MVSRLNNDKETGYSPRVAILIGLVLSLGTGFFSIAVSLLSGPFGFSSFASILPPLAVTAGILLVTYIISWFLVVSPLGRVFTFEPIPLALSLALFLGMIFTLTSVKNLVILFTKSQIQMSKLFIIFLLFFISLLPSVAAYFAAKAAHISNYRKMALIFSLAAPFVLAETMAFAWLHTYKIGAFLSISSILVSVAYIFIILFTVWLFYRIGQKIKVMRLLAISMALVLLSPLVTLISTKASKASLVGLKEGHQIKHVILIIDDTLRPDVLSCYNHQDQSVSTPHIDQLARDGLLFTKAISAAPWTIPSVSSIMTGLSPSVHGAIKINSKLPDALQTLAEYMQDAGYYTAGIGRNLCLKAKYNVQQGFIEYNFFPNQWIGSYIGLRLFRLLFPNQFRINASTRDLTKLTINWLESNYQKDFFLWIHYLDPHRPYTPPTNFLPKKEPAPSIGTRFSDLSGVRNGSFVPSLVEREWIKELYKAEVRYVDENIGKLLDTLKRLNLYDESLIIFTSDHGEEFWEHNGLGHGHTLYNELLWVPLIIKLPLSASKGKISEAVPTEGIMPTILDICGIHYRSEHLTAGSLSSLLGENTNTYVRQPIISTGLLYYKDRESVMFDELKYIRSLIANREELYDLRNDPEEHISIAASSPDGIRKARNILKGHKDMTERLKVYYDITKSEEIKLDKETIENLKSLGYIK